MGMRLSSANALGVTGIVVVYSSQHASLPGTNVLDSDPTLPWQTAADTANIIIQIPSGYGMPDYLVVHNHTMRVADTIRYRENTANSWGGATPIDTTFTLPADPYDYSSSPRAINTIPLLVGDGVYREWIRIDFTATGHADGFMRFGIINLCKMFEFSRNIDTPSMREGYENNTPAFKSKNGQPYFRPRKRPRVHPFSVTGGSLADRALVRKLAKIGRGMEYFVTPYESAAATAANRLKEEAEHTMYGRFTRLPSAVEYKNDGAHLNFEFREMV